MWIDEEFSKIEFGDKRRVKRFKHIVTQLIASF
jgi:hypothetical protein